MKLKREIENISIKKDHSSNTRNRKDKINPIMQSDQRIVNLLKKFYEIAI